MLRGSRNTSWLPARTFPSSPLGVQGRAAPQGASGACRHHISRTAHRPGSFRGLLAEASIVRNSLGGAGALGRKLQASTSTGDAMLEDAGAERVGICPLPSPPGRDPDLDETTRRDTGGRRAASPRRRPSRQNVSYRPTPATSTSRPGRASTSGAETYPVDPTARSGVTDRARKPWVHRPGGTTLPSFFKDVGAPTRQTQGIYSPPNADRRSTAILGLRNSVHYSGHSACRGTAETHKRTALPVIYLQSRRSTS